MKINGLRKPRIFPGQTLLLTRAASARSAKASGTTKPSKSAKKSKKRSGVGS